jgi:hypothetical protein
LTRGHSEAVIVVKAPFRSSAFPGCKRRDPPSVKPDPAAPRVTPGAIIPSQALGLY